MTSNLGLLSARVFSYGMNDWLPWIPLAATILHMTEEFAYPGGFAVWYRRYRVEASRITPRFLVIINGALLATCINLALVARTPLGPVYWLTIAALLCSNGIWHAWASYKSRAYSPGVLTGLIIYVPMAVYGYATFLHLAARGGSGALSVGQGTACRRFLRAADSSRFAL
jgi:hypothetical protein